MSNAIGLRALFETAVNMPPSDFLLIVFSAGIFAVFICPPISRSA